MSVDPSELTAETVRALLRYLSWEPEAAPGAPYEMWHHADDRDESQILIPTDETRADYFALLARATQSVFRRYGPVAERFAQNAVMREAGVLDTTRWKKETAVPAGLIPWEHGQALYASAQQQLAAAAKATREPRPYHGNASAHIAKRFLEQSFMGQTDVGSFIITALTPAQAKIHLTRHSEDISTSKPRESETVSGRTILETFEKALAATRAGLDEYVRTPRLEVFTEKVEAGVSYELAKALGTFASLGESAIQIDLERFGATGTRAVEYDFTPPEASVLLSVSTELAQDPEPRHVTLAGEVTLLSRTQDLSERVIRLDLLPGSPARKVRVRLGADQYELALQAHREELALEVTGTLEREGHLYWIYNVQDVSVLEDHQISRPRASLYDDALDFDSLDDE